MFYRNWHPALGVFIFGIAGFSIPGFPNLLDIQIPGLFPGLLDQDFWRWNSDQAGAFKSNRSCPSDPTSSSAKIPRELTFRVTWASLPSPAPAMPHPTSTLWVAVFSPS